MIEQAPHSPVLQQSFVPLYSNVSRRKSKSDVDVSALPLTDLPLMVVLIVRLITLPPCRLPLLLKTSAGQCFDDPAAVFRAAALITDRARFGRGHRRSLFDERGVER